MYACMCSGNSNSCRATSLFLAACRPRVHQSNTQTSRFRHAVRSLDAERLVECLLAPARPCGPARREPAVAWGDSADVGYLWWADANGQRSKDLGIGWEWLDRPPSRRPEWADRQSRARHSPAWNRCAASSCVERRSLPPVSRGLQIPLATRARTLTPHRPRRVPHRRPAGSLTSRSGVSPGGYCPTVHTE